MRWAQYEDAPDITDCVTAVRWLLALSSKYHLPTAYIGDLPNILIERWSDLVPLHERKAGDLIFFERMSPSHQKYMVNHMGLMITPNEFIHSSKKYGGKISRIDDPEYMHNILSESYLPLAHDPRNSTEDSLHHRRV